MGHWLGRWSLIAGAVLGSAGCHLLPPKLPASQLPPCVEDDCDCGDFIHQGLAQRVLEARWGDPFNLDSDGNDQACESLPAAAPTAAPTAEISQSPHLLLGNPSNSSVHQPNNYLIERPEYVLAYSRDRKLPHWVSWHLDTDWLGPVPRQDDFRADPSLPAGFYPLEPDAFRNTGYDRGHLVPAADRSRRPQHNSATFLMTNIIPQAPENNRGPWRDLEQYTRDLVYQLRRDVYVVAGAYGQQAAVGEANVAVPGRLWKVVVVLDQPDAGLAGLSQQSLVVAVDMPNQNALKPNWQAYQTSIDRIEVATGYDLLSNLPEDVEAVLEAADPSQ